MKKFLKIVTVLLLLNFISYIGVKSKASVGDYNSYAYINVDSGKLLKDYDSSVIDDELARVRNKKFMGWQIYKLNKNVRTTFITDTLFSYKNEGTSPINYTVNVESESTCKTKVSATGTIGTDVSGSYKKFKGSLNRQLKLQGEYETTQLCKSEENLEVTVDPNSLCVGYIQGEGYYTNGVACNYLFFMEKQIGAFEYFTITSSYLRIEKLSL